MQDYGNNKEIRSNKGNYKGKNIRKEVNYPRETNQKEKGKLRTKKGNKNYPKYSPQVKETNMVKKFPPSHQ